MSLTVTETSKTEGKTNFITLTATILISFEHAEAVSTCKYAVNLGELLS